MSSENNTGCLAALFFFFFKTITSQTILCFFPSCLSSSFSLLSEENQTNWDWFKAATYCNLTTICEQQKGWRSTCLNKCLQICRDGPDRLLMTLNGSTECHEWSLNHIVNAADVSQLWHYQLVLSSARFVSAVAACLFVLYWKWHCSFTVCLELQG